MRASRRLVHPSRCQRRASSSTTMNPMLWRVRAYSGPGLPSPTMSRRSSMCRNYSAAGAAAAGSAAAAGCGSGGERGVIGCRARAFDRNDDRVGRRDQREAGRQLHVAGGDVIVDVELADVDLEVLGQFARRPLDLERVGDDVHHAALIFHARRNADRDDVDRRVDRFGRGDALEIGRDRTVADRVALHFTEQHGLFLAADRRVDDVALAAAREQLVEGASHRRRSLRRAPWP